MQSTSFEFKVGIASFLLFTALITPKVRAASEQELGAKNISLPTQPSSTLESVDRMQVVKSSFNGSKPHTNRYLHKLPDDLAEPDNKKNTYIIQLNESAIGEHAPIAKTFHRFKNKGLVAQQVRQSLVKQQLNLIEQQQSDFEQSISTQLPNAIINKRFQYAINGVVINLTNTELSEIAKNDEVKRIYRNQTYRLNTDIGPTLIGSPSVWDGSAAPHLASSYGEGVIIGIIDSGINTDHPSFAQVAGDGYIHTNPLGEGVYLGDCATNFPELCNEKLIGVYSYSTITDDYTDTEVFPPNLPQNGEDYGGHGSHVAATAAGNILFDVDEVLPDASVEESSGIPTGFVFEQISGVAPRANLISYQVCYGGTEANGDTYADCPSTAILQGIESAIQDGVDVINYSIGGGGDPWNSITELAFLNARNLGVFVATSAGNSGPDTSSSDKHAPWYTSVAAVNHGREIVFSKQLSNFSGGNSSLNEISGQSNTGSITADIVYAGDFTNINDPSNDSAQCLEPFPDNTFNGQIVICDRGSIARVDKAQNVASGGAGGFVLANVQGGQSFLANDEYVIPGIHINADDGDALKLWLATGSDHRATITQSNAQTNIDHDSVDVLGSFSSRGPNTSISVLTPSVSAPGIDIYAAYADQQFGHDGGTFGASDYNYLTGTSMSSPHVAGAAALIKGVHPDWQSDEIRSALMMTTTREVLIEDGETSADHFDMGAGRIQVDQAIASGLVMSETSENYTNADPDLQGDPRSLNLPSITDNNCTFVCTWSRTFTATTDATFSIVIDSEDSDLTITSSPSSFTLLDGQSQEVIFTIDASQAALNEYAFATVSFESDGLPKLTLPVSIFPTVSDIPSSVTMNSTRKNDSLLLEDLTSVDVDTFFVTAYTPVTATIESGTVSQDSSPSDIFDDTTDGLVRYDLIVPEDSKRLILELNSETAPDVDLYLALDDDGNGVTSEGDIVAFSTSSSSIESIEVIYPTAGQYHIYVHSFTAASTSGDAYELSYALVDGTMANEDVFYVEAPNSIDADSSFELRFIHFLENSIVGDEYFTVVELGSADLDSDLGLISVDIVHVSDDIEISTTNSRVDSGQTVSYSVDVAGNSTNQERIYDISLPLPVGTEFISFTDDFDAEIINNELIWTVEKISGDTDISRLDVSLNVLEGASPGVIEVYVASQLINQSFAQIEQSVINTDVQVEGSPTISFDGETSYTLDTDERQTNIIPLEISEPNGDSVAVVWEQTSGTNANITESNGTYRLTAPSVSSDETLIYEVTVSDAHGNSVQASMTVNVNNIDDDTPTETSSGGGGSIGFTSLLLLATTIWLRRRHYLKAAVA